jgi:hypothetical protein
MSHIPATLKSQVEQRTTHKGSALQTKQDHIGRKRERGPIDIQE